MTANLELVLISLRRRMHAILEGSTNASKIQILSLLLLMADSLEGHMNFRPTFHPSGYSAVSYSSMTGLSASRVIIHPRLPGPPSNPWNQSPSKLLTLSPWMHPHETLQVALSPAPVVSPLLVRHPHPHPHLVVHHHHHHIIREQRLEKPLLVLAKPKPAKITSLSTTPSPTSSSSTTTSSTTSTTTTTTTPKPVVTSTQRAPQAERKLGDEEEGSGDGPLSTESEEKGVWEGKKDTSKSGEESVEYTHDFRDFHLGY